tara:strand:+ start:274 stop:717 length:444 start_codon:yes stop_codon:yes gene_type:complete
VKPAQFLSIRTWPELRGQLPPENRFGIGGKNLPYPPILENLDSVFKRRHQSAGGGAKSVDDLLLAVRETSQPLLAEHQFIIKPDLEDSSPALDEGRRRLESLFYCGRQTDGTGLVVSLNAIFDAYLHRCSSLTLVAKGWIIAAATSG